MKQVLMSVTLILIVMAGGWALVNRDRINSVDDAIQLAKRQISEVTQSGSPAKTASSSRLVSLENDNIRIASFNIRSFGIKKAQDQATMSYLSRIVREFDVVAVQEIRAEDTSFLNRFMAQINANGRQFDYVVSPRIGRSSYTERYAFIFDTQTIQLDAAHRYTINDPDDLLHREPFVGWFRARQARVDLAFTFTLVNVHLDSRNPDSELDYLGEVFRAVRNDGRIEDDVIIAGDFNANDQQFTRLDQRLGLSRVIIGQNTNTRASEQYDNLLFDPAGTTEFSGRSGVFDFMQIFNLTLDEALRISDHLPVWADFSIFEGGGSGSTVRQANLRD